jgi:UDP-N-acetylglucosamine acyltransferase
MTTNATLVSPLAQVHPKAELAEGVSVGPFSVIGPNVKIASGAVIASHVVIEGRTSIGGGTKIYSFATIGAAPQDLKYAGEDTELIIGERNSIREYCNISLGTVQDSGKTTIGNDNLLMVHTHVAHDCVIANKCIIANGVNLAGHVKIDDEAVLGGMVGVHQFVRIGHLVMAGGGAMVAQDVPPYCMVHGDRAKIKGLNLIGLKRSPLSRDEIAHVKHIFRLLFDHGLTKDEAIEKIKSLSQFKKIEDQFVSFLDKSTRGICRPPLES